MVRDLFERIAQPIRGLHQAAYLLAGLTLVAQLLALLRDRTFAHMFGAGEVLDLYYAAFRIPDLVFVFVASLVSAYVIIPRIAGRDREETLRILSESATFLLGVGGVICIAFFVWMPELLAYLYPSFAESSRHSEFVLLSRLLLVQPILLGLSSLFASVTQVHRRFALFAMSPVLYNLGIIVGAVVFYPRFGLVGIGVGVVLGSLAYLAVNIPVLVEARVMPRFAIPRLATMVPIIRDSVPRSLALGMGSITALILTAFASRIGTGSISVFSFASNLQAVPLALIGASYAVAAFPALSEASADKNEGEFTRILSSGARHIILWSIVSLGLIVVLRAHLVRVILGTGAFDWDATRLTAALLALLAIGIVAQGLVLLFSRALYAVRESWQPLVYQLVGGAVTVGLALFFLSLDASTGFPVWLAEILRVGDVAGTRVLLLALAGTIGQILIALLALFSLVRVAPGLSSMLVRPLFHGTLATLVGGVATYTMLAFEGSVAELTTLFAVFTQGFVAGMVGLTASALTLFLLKNEEFQTAVGALSRLVSRKDLNAEVLVPSAEENPQP
jgi:putative peptidoglycan lipid II flippase